MFTNALIPYSIFCFPMRSKEAIFKWCENQLGITRNSESMDWPCWVLSRACFSSIRCLFDTEHVALVLDPCYHFYLAGIKVTEGVIELVPLLNKNRFLKDPSYVILNKISHGVQIIWRYAQKRGPP